MISTTRHSEKGRTRDSGRISVCQGLPSREREKQLIFRAEQLLHLILQWVPLDINAQRRMNPNVNVDFRLFSR